MTINPDFRIPTSDLPPLTNDIKEWDAVLRYAKSSAQPGLTLQQQVALTRTPGFALPAGMPQPWAAKTPREQLDSLARFNAVADALQQLASTEPKVLGRVNPRDITVFDTFAFQTPKAGYFVKLVISGALREIPVYRR